MTVLRIKGPEKLYFGKDKATNERIYLSRPRYDCDWYWSFGYLGNRNLHYHLCHYAKGRNINMYDALSTDYELASKISKELWSFCEQAKTIYTLKDAAEVLYRGGSHYGTNPESDFIKQHNNEDQLNQIVLPRLLQSFWSQFGNVSHTN